MPLKANLSSVPTTCPECGFESTDPEEMLGHWVEARELNFNGNTVELPGGGKSMQVKPASIQNPLAGLSKFSIEELLQRKDGLPWWVGLGLIMLALSFPQTRLALRRIVGIAFQLVTWAMVLIVSLIAMIALVVMLVGPRVWDVAARWFAG